MSQALSFQREELIGMSIRARGIKPQEIDDPFRRLQGDGEVVDYEITLEGGAESKLRVKERERGVPFPFSFRSQIRVR